MPVAVAEDRVVEVAFEATELRRGNKGTLLDETTDSVRWDRVSLGCCGGRGGRVEEDEEDIEGGAAPVG